MNRRRGFMRLAGAIGIPYFGWWGLVGTINYNAIDRYLAKSRIAADKSDWRTSSMWMEQVNRSSQAVNDSLFWGLLVPFAVLIVAAMALWVYRGFKT